MGFSHPFFILYLPLRLKIVNIHINSTTIKQWQKKTVKSKDFEALLRKEVRDARTHYLGAKQALMAYLASNNTENNNVTNISSTVRKAAQQFRSGQTFTARDIFNEINKGDMNYDQTRPTISLTLSQMVKEGALKKMSWKEFCVVGEEDSGDDNRPRRKSVPGQKARSK